MLVDHSIDPHFVHCVYEVYELFFSWKNIYEGQIELQICC